MERSPFQMSLSIKRFFRGGQEERNQIYRLVAFQIIMSLFELFVTINYVKFKQKFAWRNTKMNP